MSTIDELKALEARLARAGSRLFTRVEMRDVEIIDHGSAAVVSCTGVYEGPRGAHTLRFMRVWLKSGGRWQIIAGTTAPLEKP